MSDTSLNKIIQYGTSTDRIAFTPDPASGSQVLYLWYETDNPPDTYAWDGSAWVQIGGGGGSGGLTQIAQHITSSSTTIDFSGISGSFSALLLTFTAQASSGSTGAENFRCKVNNDGTSGNYSTAVVSGSNNGSAFLGNQAASGDGGWIGIIPDSGNTGIPASGYLFIIGYAATTLHKMIQTVCGAEQGAGPFTSSSSFRWKNTAAITQLTVRPEGVSFADGGIFTLYGLQ